MKDSDLKGDTIQFEILAFRRRTLVTESQTQHITAGLRIKYVFGSSPEARLARNGPVASCHCINIASTQYVIFPKFNSPRSEAPVTSRAPAGLAGLVSAATGLLRSHGAVPLGLHPVLPRLVSRLLPVSLGPIFHLGVCTRPRPVLPPGVSVLQHFVSGLQPLVCICASIDFIHSLNGGLASNPPGAYRF